VSSILARSARHPQRAKLSPVYRCRQHAETSKSHICFTTTKNWRPVGSCWLAWPEQISAWSSVAVAVAVAVDRGFRR